MKKLFFTFLLNTIFAIGFSQTNVSGPYFSNLTWDLSGSPYTITGDVQIPKNVTLTIEPGVEVNISGNYEILIKGSLNAVGTNLLPIKFKGSTGVRTMVMFKGADLSLSKLSYLQFEGPKNAIQLGDESESSQDVIKNSGVLTVSNVSLKNTKIQTKGYWTNASLVLENVTASETTIKGVYPRSEPIEIKNSNFNYCIIDSDAYNAGITIRNSEIISSDLIIGCCGGNFNIVSSLLKSSKIIEGEGSPVMGPLKISDTRLENTPINLPAATVEIKHSFVSYQSSNAIILGNGSVQCSEIIGNGSGAALTITGKKGYDLGGSININKSHIAQNTIGVKISDVSSIKIENSNFDNNSLYHIENRSNKDINASNNFWDTTDPLVILSKNYDYYDNINYGVINTSDFLTSPNLDQDCIELVTSVFGKNNKQTLSSVEARVFPNPASNFVNLIFDNLNNSKDLTIEIVNTMGKQYFISQINGSTNIQNIDVSEYPKGVYFCNIQNGHNRITKKIIVQ